MTSLSVRLQAVRARIASAAQQFGRDPGSVSLLAVSKTWPAAPIAELAAAGQRAFGENHVQEALDKIRALAALDLEWHFIGPLQANKTRPVAENFAWVHSVDRLRIAERLSLQRPTSLPPLSVCIQVNVSGETTKSGVSAADAPALARSVAALPRLRLRGLMAIPAPTDDFAGQRRAFRCLRELLERLTADGLSVDTLSMGMSDDLEAAIAEGSTLVRVGTAIFGERY
ncbi:YggS family pyridoxal phosphate-dependent enzyme [Accumulibacter sp.]|uniref:YggS family pyridoxal phosphate-dependent enzyme n=1 Tax=Accumulibacter sp. TaxID=2053492 RepID=UPI0025FB4ACE|nr:YggS family pyridoxal phosphate-dependent enzyme [Accumulibacter sp.]MCM8594418.1 YggS family pyridoxal phosphate-dependent enzyme [Accumulibacter sp.]MCM8624946.1 YggS family pyridoxal phosphate-dependent enzyme [Accumulibacter sp.]MDS4048563.1 YggS family pyridoxal phosphate-dependent enzyme [Accumulibacter sp.]